MSPTLELWILRICPWLGLAHLIQLPAMAFVPKILRWQTELARLSPINQRLFAVVTGGIVLCVNGLGLVVFAGASDMLHSRLGTALSAFLFCFWTYRAVVQLVVYPTLWPERARWAHWVLCALFPSLALAYAGLLLAGLAR
jgi:hypothetical protein